MIIEGNVRVAGTVIHNTPEETFVILPIKLFINGCRNVKHRKSAGDIEEQGSECEVLSGTGPVNGTMWAC